MIKDIETLNKFISDRPKLKVKVDELFKVLHIDSESGKSPIIEEISVYGGNDSYTDDGKHFNGSYVRSSQDLQEIDFYFTLVSEKEIRAKLTQKLSNFKNVFRITFSEGLFGKKGKKHAEKLVGEALYIAENNINPFQDKLNMAKDSLKNLLDAESAVKKEMEQLEKIKESVPKAYSFIKHELWSASNQVDRARSELSVIQSKFDNVKKEEEEK